MKHVCALLWCGTIVLSCVAVAGDGQAAGAAPSLSSLQPWVAPPQVCYAPDTPPEVVARNAARRLWHAVAYSLSVLGADKYVFDLGYRWTRTATDGSGLGQGDPTTLTWGVIADGVAVPGFNGEPDATSDLRAFLDGVYGSSAVWLPLFEQIFASWGEKTGITYVYMATDDGASLGSASGTLGVRPDIRIGGHPIDGNGNILAYNFYPNNGDMIIDTADAFYTNTSSNSLGLRNVLAHEHGHGLGLGHVCPISQTKLMEPYLTFAFDGPQHDDVLAANRGYGDARESNDSAAGASNLGAPGTTTLTLDDLSLDDPSDADFFSFTVAADASIDVVVSPVGATYFSGAQNTDGSCSTGSSYSSVDTLNLAIAILGPDGETVVSSADAAVAGLGELLENVVLSSGAGTYFARITGTGALDAQLYRLELTVRDDGEPPPFGACCLGDGGCSRVTQAGCGVIGGSYQGDLTTCAEVSCQPSELLDQQPDQDNGYFSDQGCELCDTGEQAQAENFSVAGPVTLTSLTLWGGYFPDSSPPISDSFTVVFHSDAGGAPGAVFGAPQTVLTTRLDSGQDLFSVDVYEFTLTLSSPLTLTQGIYWVEVFNDTGGDSDSFFWESGSLDVTAGIAGSAFDNAHAPGVTWYLDGDVDLALVLHTTSSTSMLFADSFEDGTLSAWSSSVP